MKDKLCIGKCIRKTLEEKHKWHYSRTSIGIQLQGTRGKTFECAKKIIDCQYLPDLTTGVLGGPQFYTGQEIKRWEETNEKGWKTTLKSHGFAGCFFSHILSDWCFPLNKFVETIPNQIHFGFQSEKGEEKNIQILWPPIYDYQPSFFKLICKFF